MFSKCQATVRGPYDLRLIATGLQLNESRQGFSPSTKTKLTHKKLVVVRLYSPVCNANIEQVIGYQYHSEAHCCPYFLFPLYFLLFHTKGKQVTGCKSGSRLSAGVQPARGPEANSVIRGTEG